MNAVLVTDHSHDRRMLSDILPLNMPLSLTVLASGVCNFRCHYCVHGTDDPVMDKIKSTAPFMTLETARLLAKRLQEGICQTGTNAQPLKRIILAGYGEPLLNREIAGIVAAFKQARVAQQVVIVSNAAALSRDVADGLIDAGLDLLRVSIQGITDQQYWEQSRTKVDVASLCENLRYYYQHKKPGQTVYLKIMNEQLENDMQRRRFLELFGDLCDEIAFESLAPVLSKSSKTEETAFGKGINEQAASHAQICPIPFYSLHVLSNGDIATCCYYDHCTTFGNVKKDSILQVWRSGAYKQFLAAQLQGKSACGDCAAYRFTMRAEDNLDPGRDALMSKYP